MSEPHPDAATGAAGRPVTEAFDPSIFETILPNGLHFHYATQEEIAAAARRADGRGPRKTALLDALRRRLEER